MLKEITLSNFLLQAFQNGLKKVTVQRSGLQYIYSVNVLPEQNISFTQRKWLQTVKYKRTSLFNWTKRG